MLLDDIHIPEHVLQSSSFVIPVIVLTILLLVLYHAKRSTANPALTEIPLVTYEGPLGSWLGGLMFPWLGWAGVTKGYQQYKHGLFRIAQLDKFEVYVSSEKMVRELRDAPENVVSFQAFLRDALQFHYTVPGFFEKNNPRSAKKTRMMERTIALLRGRVAKSLPSLLPGIQEEVCMVVKETAFSNNEWHSVKAFHLAENVVAQAIGRILVGPQLCRNRKWIDNAISYGPRVVIASQIVGILPTSLKRIAASLTGIDTQLARSRKLLMPIIKERIEAGRYHSHEKPNDILQWLLDGTTKDHEMTETEISDLADTVFVVNLPGIHTTAQSLTSALYQLAAHPEVIQPLRAEIEAVVAEENGWSKSAIDRMWNLDSFVKETNRIYPPGTASLTRRTTAPFTFSNGTTLPSGTFVSASGGLITMDGEFYENPEVFDPFRFSRRRAEEGDSMRWIATSTKYLMFGDGKQACPGRVLAADVVKFTLAHIVSNFDMKMESGKRPENHLFGTIQLPSMTDSIYFKARQASFPM